jgi:hypothetical protein
MYSLAQPKFVISKTTAISRFAQISDVNIGNDDAILGGASFVFDSLPTYGVNVLHTDERRKFKRQVASEAYITGKGRCIAIMT